MYGNGRYAPWGPPERIEAKDPRPVEREKHKPTSNAAVDGYTRYARRVLPSAPGDFVSAAEADRYDSMPPSEPFGDYDD